MFACFRLCEEGASNASLVTFNIGLLFGLSLCLSLSTAIFVLPLLWITYQARTLCLRTFIAFLLGLFVPILYTTVFLVATDNLIYLEHYIDSWSLGSGAMWQMMSDPTWIYLLSTAVITVFVMVRVMLTYTESVRRSPALGLLLPHEAKKQPDATNEMMAQRRCLLIIA